MNHYLEIHPEVQEALQNGRAVVALESTIISHGMPYPQNVEMAQKTEGIIRERGAVPATIAILHGKIKIGLTEEELELFATEKGIRKVSRRDLPYVLARGEHGAVTVAGTMICAAMAGIRFFVTGGIGGVHRGYEEDMDVSADLEEVARTDVTVVCAGAKAILDLPRTMEYLETKGVPVIGYQTDELPAFYTRTSGIALAMRADEPEEIAAMHRAKEQAELSGGMLVCNPIPEADSLDGETMNTLIEEAIAESKIRGVRGKDVTPFLLDYLVQKTEGKSLAANLALVYNNAALGANIAVAYQKRVQKENSKTA